VYPFLSALGVQDRTTPALTSEALLQLATGTVEQTRFQLARKGIVFHNTGIERLLENQGSRALEYRTERVLSGSASELGDVTGLRIAICTDGGRLKTRIQKKRGRKKSNGRRGYHTEWKEPKVITIYELDEKGRRQRKHGFRYYDGTMGDADEAFKLLAGILSSIKAHQALEWVVLGDGAVWIWNRIDDLVKAVGYDKKKVTEVVDLYHAREKLHKFAKTVKSFSGRQRTRWTNKMLKLLDEGRIKEMGIEFSQFFKGRNSKVRRSLAAYFDKNTERMRYQKFREDSIPLGSGAVESLVRRLVNLRMKGNGIFWKLPNAERLLYLRSQLLAGRWNQLMDQILQPSEFWKLSQAV
jgi:hypothetical protein